MKFDLNKRYCYYFNELSMIPRGSCDEKKACAWVAAFAKKNHLYCHQDKVGNTVIRKPGSKGHENEPYLMIQAHLDMITEKDPEIIHDFKKDPLDLFTEDGYLKARGTTLGADDGVGIAYMMAILEDVNLVHPPLECVFTVQEEIGLVGAMQMKPKDILSRRCISLDGGGETTAMSCAAGGIKGEVRKKLNWKPANRRMQAYSIEADGLLGGHSGVVIGEGRGNAIRILARILNDMKQNGLKICMSEMNGGNGDNMIPQKASAVILCAKKDASAVKKTVSRQLKQIRNELADSDSGVQIRIKKTMLPEKVLEADSYASLLALLLLLPNGVEAVSIPLQGLPVTSNNLGRITVSEGSNMILYFRIRSLIQSAMDDVLSRMHTAADVFDAKIAITTQYPGWNYQKESALRDHFQKLVKEIYHRDIVIEGTHGGNETGVWSSMHPDTDIICIGSIEDNIHTTKERLNLEAFDREYNLLCRLIESCAED